MFSNMSDISDKDAKKIINHIEKYSNTNRNYIFSGSSSYGYAIYIYTENYLYVFPTPEAVTKRFPFYDGPSFNSNNAHNETLNNNYWIKKKPSHPYLCPCVRKLNLYFIDKFEISDEYKDLYHNESFDRKVLKKDNIEFISLFIKDEFIDKDKNWVIAPSELWYLYTNFYVRKGHMNPSSPDETKAHAINALIHPVQINLLSKINPHLK